MNPVDVVVLGSYVQDHCWVTETFPGDGESRIGRFSTGPGGKGFNQAVACHRQGVGTAFLGAIGQTMIFMPDLPDLKTVFGLIAEDMVAEKVAYADNLPTHNPLLLQTVKALFADSDHAMLPHATILGEMAARAKVIVRTGAFDPWGNILLYSGVDVPQWFSKPCTVAPPEYAAKMTKG